MAAMVVIILAQVFFRHVIGSPLAWPAQAARFPMLWAAALMIATKFRRGGLVSIDILVRILPLRLASALSFVLVAAQDPPDQPVQHHRIGWRFKTDSLRVPMSFDPAAP